MTCECCKPKTRQIVINTDGMGIKFSKQDVERFYELAPNTYGIAFLPAGPKTLKKMTPMTKDKKSIIHIGSVPRDDETLVYMVKDHGAGYPHMKVIEIPIDAAYEVIHSGIRKREYVCQKLNEWWD